MPKNHRCPAKGCGAGFDSAQQLSVHQFSAHKRVYELTDIVHGTVAGYQKHKRRRQPVCAKCLNAWREYYEKRRSSSHKK